jgi:signal transduction histidine kinase/CRP-like cAMP-binding protein
MQISDDRIKSLSTTSIFNGLTDEQLRSIVKDFKEVRKPAGTILITYNTPPATVYIIVEGSVRISRFTTFGEETTLNSLQVGEVVGELSAIDGRGRSARATCAVDCVLFEFSKGEFESLLRTNQIIAQNMLKELGSHIRRANDTIVERLEEQRATTEKRMNKLFRLVEASKIINSTLDLDKLLGLILNSAASSIEADRGTLYLVDPFKQELWSKVLQGSNMVEIRLPIGKGIAGYVAQTGETINIVDAYNDARFNPEVDKRTGYRTRNMLCMAMKNKDGKITGVFQLMNKKDGAFDSDDEQFIDAFSAHASVAIENARMAQEMVQNERLSAVGRMASVIIHDIKNPMGTIRVYAQVMKKKSGNEEANKLADEMIHQVDRFVNMTQEILDFTRGVSATNFTDLEFGEAMNKVLDFVEQDLTKNKIKLTREAKYTGVIKLDQDKMVRVFYNIASNARDAMPNGGTLTVRTREDNGFVNVEFVDSGTGMPEEVKKRIFEPFMTFGKKHGTGLGMAIVKKVVDDHGGKIEIDSEMGKGTTIRFLIPIKRLAEEQQAQPQTQPQEQRH